MENNHSYLNKLGGIMRLYAAIQITTNRRGENSPHPHSINHGWIWLCNFVNFGKHLHLIKYYLENFTYFKFNL